MLYEGETGCGRRERKKKLYDAQGLCDSPYSNAFIYSKPRGYD